MSATLAASRTDAFQATLLVGLRHRGFPPHTDCEVGPELLEIISYPFPEGAHGGVSILVREHGKPWTMREEPIDNVRPLAG